jgi:signal transduction histidine kinase
MRIAVERTLAEAFGTLNSTQRQMLEIALTNVDKLGAVITELLDVVRLGAESEASVGRIFDLRALAEDGVNALRPQSEAKEVTLLVNLPDAPVEVNGDQRKIGRVLSNLLGNAVKFNRPGGEVRLCVERKDDQWAQVSVSDTGIGIPEEAMDKVFSRFFQVESVSTRVHEGLGLGLAIVKEYVEQGGGEIWVESEEGKGSVFTFTLPLA